MSLRDACKQFLDYCSLERRLSQCTLDAYAYDLADFRKWLPKDHDLPSIKTCILRDYLEDMVNERKLSAATVRRRFACLRAFFRYSEDTFDIANPFDGWKLSLPRRKRLPRALSHGEASSLLSSSSNLSELSCQTCEATLRMALRLLISTGVRIGELCRLHTDDVVHDGAALRIHGKGSRDRVVYVSDPSLRTDLRELVRMRQKLFGTSSPLFLNSRGSRMRPHSIRQRLGSFAELVGIKRRVTPHMLRHTAATLLIETGVDIRIVQKLLGHSSIATTEIYTHVSDQTLRMSLERANILGGLAAQGRHQPQLL
jgi:integrase/recombinase XerD